ncbi:RecX family transcriptional regulator, partial [Candidatus Dojkabacteria bacterium]|nr:RecX family transcriptional regulator [Candidatus Dojkabacteria bacterium]
LIEDSIKKYYPEENEEEYIYKLALKKYKLLEKEEENKRKQKTLAYLLRKGFEYDKIASVLTKLENEQNKK